MDVPDELDITSLRGHGLQPGEVELPDEAVPLTNQEPVTMEIDEGIVMQLVSMGFDMEGCKKAVFNTNNQGGEEGGRRGGGREGGREGGKILIPPNSKNDVCMQTHVLHVFLDSSIVQLLIVL